MLKIVIFCALLGFIQGQTTTISQCILSRDAPLPLNTYVQGCINPPCLLPQLQNVVVDVIFRAPRILSNMTTLATASLNFIIEVNIDYNLEENAETCNFFTNTFCPLLEGEVVQYRLMMMIESFFPVGTQATIEFRIVDNDRNQDVIMCFRLPIRIMPAESNTREKENLIL